MLSKLTFFADYWSENIRLFFIRNKFPMLAAFIAGIFVYGVELTNLTFGIDEEIFQQTTDKITSYGAVGRWGLILLWYILPDISMNFLSPVMTLIFLTLTSVIISEELTPPRKITTI